jgi:hypothetical protein
MKICRMCGHFIRHYLESSSFEGVETLTDLTMGIVITISRLRLSSRSLWILSAGIGNTYAICVHVDEVDYPPRLEYILLKGKYDGNGTLSIASCLWAMTYLDCIAKARSEITSSQRLSDWVKAFVESSLIYRLTHGTLIWC